MTKKIITLFIILFNFFNYTEVLGQLKVIPITEEEYNSSKFTHLSSMKDEFKGVEIIGLGEPVHDLGGAYKAKTKMVKFLHEECGFDVLAFEAPFYNLGIVGEKLKNGDLSLPEIVFNNCAVWSVLEMNELYRYILETQKTKNPLEYVGFDIQFFDKTLKHSLKDDFPDFVEQLNLATKSNIIVDSLCRNSLDIIEWKSYYFKGIEAQDTIVLHNTIKEIRVALDKLDHKTAYFSHWNQITNSIEADYRKTHEIVTREEPMAKNVLYLRDKYKGKKIILWAATSHLVSNIHSIKRYKDKKDEELEIPMGTFIRKELKDKYYVIGFSPYQGKGGFSGYLGLGKVRFKSSKGSIEHYVKNIYNTDYAFISLGGSGVEDQLKKLKIDRSNVSTRNFKFNLPEYVDGIYMYENEELIHSNSDLFKELHEK